jgi:3-methyl-2-oxobutanoate hydroxymethyltransferase
MPKVTLSTLQKLKQSGEKIAALTCYDSTFASVAGSAGIEVLLVGDTLGMVLQGHENTLPVTMENMLYHTACVANADSGAFVIADMPFMSFSTVEAALNNAGRLLQAGANMVKIEGGV